MKPLVDIRILPATEADSEAFAKFYQKYFFPDEPLNNCLQRNPTLEEIPFIGALKEGLSFKAVDIISNSVDNLAGVVINKELSIDKKTNLDTIICPKRLKIYKLLKELDQKAEVWEKVNNENHFNVVAVSVNNKYRGMRIGQRLVEESLKLAKERNFKYATIECSSFYSARFAAEMGFELLAEIPYDKYLDENGEPIFKINKPHVAIKKLIKTL